MGALLLAVLSAYTGRLLRDAGFSVALRDKCWPTYSLTSTASSALPPTAPHRNIGDGCGRLLALETLLQDFFRRRHPFVMGGGHNF
jgi:hypothetical protein